MWTGDRSPATAIPYQILLKLLRNFRARNLIEAIFSPANEICLHKNQHPSPTHLSSGTILMAVLLVLSTKISPGERPGCLYAGQSVLMAESKAMVEASKLYFLMNSQASVAP